VIHTAQRYRQESSGGLLYDRSQASAAEFLKKVKLQFADFYRVSKKLGLHEFKELMNAKASASDVDGILFIEVGDRSKKRSLDDRGTGPTLKFQKLEDDLAEKRK